MSCYSPTIFLTLNNLYDIIILVNKLLKFILKFKELCFMKAAPIVIGIVLAIGGFLVVCIPLQTAFSLAWVAGAALIVAGSGCIAYFLRYN